MRKFDLNQIGAYKHPVTNVTAFETEEGIGNRCGDARARGKTGGC